MLPSSTVENYLKAIYVGDPFGRRPEAGPDGQLAAALGIAPGTATTMVKALRSQARRMSPTTACG
jgi:Mn-dependent DtxR family transcriptional regulator